MLLCHSTVVQFSYFVPALKRMQRFVCGAHRKVATVSACRWFAGDGSSRGTDDSEFFPPARSTSKDYVRTAMERAVAAGRMSPKAGEKFVKAASLFPEAEPLFDAVQREIGGQNPDKFTTYQRQMFNEKLTNYCAHEVTNAFQKHSKDQQIFQKHNEDGTPTGENFWVEAPELMNHEFPPEVREQIYSDLKNDRKPGSEAEAPPGFNPELTPTPKKDFWDQS
jgi:hypothetical protein